MPRAETAPGLFAAGFLFLGLVLLAEAIVGPAVFRQRSWRACLWPSLALFAGVWLWVITIFSTFSTLHLFAHSLWAQAATAAGAVQLAVVRGRLSSPYWSLVTAAALFLVASVFQVGEAFKPRRAVWAYGLAATWIALAVMLFADRDVAPIFGHLSDLAGRVSAP